MNQMEKPFDKHNYALGQIPNVFVSREVKKYTQKILKFELGKWQRLNGMPAWWRTTKFNIHKECSL